ncbi:MAG TPA: acyl-CoA dehydrogenase [Syntrophomonadaceae bacterium]|nr:acyl-CoA dehydrogenase [Syntrophomonadaceae bacterium]HQE24140.1 acyl-CoA dehydrogenase [Syntrophomonadaceae bacterium]
MATNYLFNHRDHKFIYKEWLDMEKIFSLDAYKDYYTLDDIDTYLNLAYKLAKEVLAPTNDEGDQLHAQLVDGQVKTPPSFKNAYMKVMEAGLGPQSADRKTEGKIPLSLNCSISETLMAANMALVIYWGLTSGAAGVIQKYADSKYQNLFLPKMFSGQWSGTMNLTEPGAGSDVGDILTKAYPTDVPGIYKIKGTKQFISAGDHDLAENIIHLVLARIDGAREGTAGISLFMVPKYWVNDDGSMGDLNDIQVVSIENKMGVKGSATCVLSYGENDNCRGILLGDPPGEDGRGQGMKQMFNMMNEERLGVSSMALANAYEAYENSLQYAKERIQGRLITDPKGPRVKLIQHEDIRRMLLYQKSVIEALRALIVKTYYYIDLSHDSPDPAEREFADMMVQINTPLCKAYASDMVWKMVAEAIQVYGGYGFIEEYPVAQIARDCKIHSIWEGTNYIQSMDLVGRKFLMGQGKPFRKWLKEIKRFIEENETEKFAKEFSMLSRAFQAYQQILAALQGYLTSGKIAMMPLYSTRILHATAILYCGSLLLSQALIAAAQLEKLGPDHYDIPFYRGKISSAKFYIMNVVPKISALQMVIEEGDDSALGIPEDGF